MSKELLFSLTKKDFKIEYFSGTGAGGQHRNKHKNCVRLFHTESNTRVTGQSSKERQSNLKEAFKNLTNHINFKLWHNQKVNEIIAGKTLEQKVDEMMDANNLKVEGRNEAGNWGDLI